MLNLKDSSQFLYLASGVKNGEGFWFVGLKNSEENILADENLLDCHRKELIGDESAKDILNAFSLGESINILDIGSNDGSLLKQFKKIGHKVQGFDPASSVANVAIEAGIPTFISLFDLEKMILILILPCINST